MSDHDQRTKRYVPAAGTAALTGVYDLVMRLTMRESRWRPRLIDAVAVDHPEGGTVTDIGAGTGTLAIAMARKLPAATVIAVDGDPAARALALDKEGSSAVKWVDGMAGRLPLDDDSSDRVTMTLLLHHLGPDDKREALAEVRRILRPSGRFHVADWGQPMGIVPRAGFACVRRLDGMENTADHAAGRLSELITQCGFSLPRLEGRLPTVWGTLESMSFRPV